LHGSLHDAARRRPAGAQRRVHDAPDGRHHPLPAAFGHDGVYAGSAQALDSAGARCAEYAHAAGFRVAGRAVAFGPFRGTIGEDGGLRMIYGRNTIVGHFEGNAFRGVLTFQVPPCTYAMRLLR
jgi:hypothetical protein